MSKGVGSLVITIVFVLVITVSVSAVYGMGIIVAPIIGPTLGGWITDNYSWRWIFYINVPVGVLAVLMAQWFIEDPPYIKAQTGSHRLHRLWLDGARPRNIANRA